MGTSDLEGIHSDGGIERRVQDIRWHPKYKPGRVYFDAGVVIASKLVTFTAFVRPVCLPYLPVDYEDEFEGKFVTLAGWGYAIEARSGLTELTSNLKLRSLTNDEKSLLFKLRTNMTQVKENFNSKY